jgi:hypothetical protein
MEIYNWKSFWHVYVLMPGYFVWPCSPHIHRTEFVTSHNEQKTKAIKCDALQVWPISTLMPLESKRRQNTINNTDWNVSCYCNSKLPRTYTWSGTFILKDGRYISFFFFFFLMISNWKYLKQQQEAIIYAHTFSIPDNWVESITIYFTEKFNVVLITAISQQKCVDWRKMQHQGMENPSVTVTVVMHMYIFLL